MVVAMMVMLLVTAVLVSVCVCACCVCVCASVRLCLCVYDDEVVHFSVIVSAPAASPDWKSNCYRVYVSMPGAHRTGHFINSMATNSQWI